MANRKTVEQEEEMKDSIKGRERRSLCTLKAGAYGRGGKRATLRNFQSQGDFYIEVVEIS